MSYLVIERRTSYATTSITAEPSLYIFADRKNVIVWRAGGDASAFNLALTYLSWGRLHMLRGDLKEATRMTSLSESVFVRDIGSEQGVMVYVHFNYGNLQSLQKHWDLALRSYTSCLEIGKREFRLHPITAAAYYSIACIEFELGHAEVAR
jgi:hypothetical protein